MANNPTDELKEVSKESKQAASDLDKLKQSWNQYLQSIDRSKSVLAGAAEKITALGYTSEQWQKAQEKASKTGTNYIKEQISAVGNLVDAFEAAAEGTSTYKQQFNDFAGQNFLGKIVLGYDELTIITNKLKSAAIDIGNVYGKSFSSIQNDFSNYSAAIRLAQDFTYKTRSEIESESISLARAGISMDEMTKSVMVGGTAQNMLSEGFLLASQTGMDASETFKLMATASREMGISTDNAGKPLLALQALARNTGLPFQDLANNVFKTAEQYARFGMTVESISPIVKRFADILGPNFKGLASQEAMMAIKGLAGDVNKAEGAFMMFQSKQVRPNEGFAQAMLDFEANMAKPEEAMKMLASSLGSLAGGKVLTFKEARDSEAAATQFKIQRDMLQQLTGINDPQQQRTLMNILSNLQSGKSVTKEQTDTLKNALKSGQEKQDERATMSERFMKVISGLMADVDMKFSAFAEKNIISPQAQAGLARSAEFGTQNFVSKILKQAEEFGNNFFGEAGKKIKDVVGSTLTKVNNAYEPGTELQGRNVPYSYSPFFHPAMMNNQQINLPAPVQPLPVFGTGQTTAPTNTKETIIHTAKKEEPTNVNVTLTIKPVGELAKVLANSIHASIDANNRGR